MYRLIVLLCAVCCCVYAAFAAPSAESKHVTVNGKAFPVKVVRVPADGYRVKVGLAKGSVGAVESLGTIAKRYNAVAAINGCFFDAYTANTIKPPYHHLITDGSLVHVGNTGTTLGFDAEGQYRMEPLKVSIRGGTDGKWSYPNNWYAYFINHPIENANAAVLFTKHWVGARTPGQGTQVVVQDGKVASLTTGAQQTAKDGFVLVLAGKEQYLSNRFGVGRPCEFRMEYKSADPDFWGRAQEALGCGPRLVREGAVAVDPASEGFSHAKIMSLACQRSAIGVLQDGTILLVTCGNATIPQLAGVMKALCVYDAMNLDGGASSGLWANGSYLTSPGRDISNALVIVPRK